jgi:hypothetical protein
MKMKMRKKRKVEFDYITLLIELLKWVAVYGHRHLFPPILIMRELYIYANENQGRPPHVLG